MLKQTKGPKKNKKKKNSFFFSICPKFHLQSTHTYSKSKPNLQWHQIYKQFELEDEKKQYMETLGTHQKIKIKLVALKEEKHIQWGSIGRQGSEVEE